MPEAENCVGVQVDEVLPADGFECLLLRHHSSFLRSTGSSETADTERGERRGVERAVETTE
jgi:hypothetical protein